MAATLHAAYDEQSKVTPDAAASLCRGEHRQCLTYAAVCKRSIFLATRLRQRVCRSSGREAGGADAEHCPTVAVHVSRTHPDFLPILLALSRLACPFVLLSSDLPDRSLQDARNSYILQSLQPLLCVVATRGDLHVAQDQPMVETVALADIELESMVEVPSSNHSEVLSFLFTGGTQRTKIVMATHAMFLHERLAYRELWRPMTDPPVVLAHTSVYWGASALGQMSIALAYGGVVVWTEATEVAQLQRCIAEERVTVLGLVPDHLDLLAPEDPGQELPHVEVVFTWGERLPRRVADRWRGHPRAVLRELLISTEYWLSLWADPLGDAILQKVRGVDLLILKDSGDAAEVGEIGELCISGPMVMKGYLDRSNAAQSKECHIDWNGTRFFRTSDLVRRASRGLVYKGRADMMAKDKGKWVDMVAVEDQILSLSSVRAAKILADPSQEHFHAFVVFELHCSPVSALDTIRMLLPARVQVWVVGPQLPRHPVTRKVDSARLLHLVAGAPPSWPLEGYTDFRCAPADLQERLSEKLYSHAFWFLLGLLVVVAVAEPNSFQKQLPPAIIWIVSVAQIQTSDWEDSYPHLLGLTACWFVAVIILGTRSWSRLLLCGRSLLLFSYLWHFIVYIDGERVRSRAARKVMLVLDNFPMHKLGFFVCLSIAQHCPGCFGMLSRAILIFGALAGAAIALARRRLFSWTVMLWTVGAGNQLHVECQMWLCSRYWEWRMWQIYELVAYMCSSLLSLRKRFVASRSPVAVVVGDSEELHSTSKVRKQCTQCAGDIAEEESGGMHEWQINQRSFCGNCAVASAVELERASSAWLLSCVNPAIRFRPADGLMSNAPHGDRDSVVVEPLAKRRRTNEGSAGSGHTSHCNGDHTVNAGGNKADHARLQGRANCPPDGEKDKLYYARLRDIEKWWWYDHVCTMFDLDSRMELQIARSLGSAQPRQATNPVPTQNMPVQTTLLIALISQIEPLLKPVHLQTVLIGLDSLRTMRLATAIKSQMGRSLSVAQIRSATTVAELASAVASAEENRTEVDNSIPDDGSGKSYTVWFSPGQYGPMGNWILRTDEALDYVALRQATQQLVDRHAALRLQVTDSMRYMSIIYDAATLFGLYMPTLSAWLPWTMQVLQPLISWSLARTWPRVHCGTREALYRSRYPDAIAPLRIVQIDGGQERFEYTLKAARNTLKAPGEITGYQIDCHLVDVWAWQQGWQGNFVIMRTPSTLVDAVGSNLVYVDISTHDWGPLLSPSSPLWQTPPYGFPALFYIPLCGGAVAWLRLEYASELRFCYREGIARSYRSYHLVANRAAPQRGREVHEPVKITYLSVSMFHCFSDGSCYLPLVHDLLSFYDAARQGTKPCNLAPSGVPFCELERRLMDTFYMRPSPMRHSLRGSIWKFRGRGYTHDIGLDPGATRAISQAAARYRVPFDIALLGMVVCAQARADGVDKLEFTLYAPMRDGAAEAMAVGLFSDWRDLCVDVDRELATHLGTVLQICHKIQHRQWSVFNALRKPERTLVNIQPLDFEQRAGFVHLGENLWHGGDQLNRVKNRPDSMDFVRQPLTWVIEQQDEEIWWILAAVAYDGRDSRWMRRFLYAFHEAFWAFLSEPLAPVHMELPTDEELVMAYVGEGPVSGIWGEDIMRAAIKATS